MLIPQEEITIVMDVSGSMLADPELLDAFQRIIFVICAGSYFSGVPIDFYVLGSSLKKVNIESFLNLSNDAEKNDFIMRLGSGSCKMEKLLNIQKPGPKLFLSDGMEPPFSEIEKIKSEWILTCRSADVMNFTPKINSFIPLLSEWGTLEVDTLQKIIDEISLKRKNITVVCREYESILVL